MDARAQELQEWGMVLRQYHLPRWEELPTIQLYKDQVIALAEEYLSILPGGEKLLTSAMINNYVKLRMVPSPVGKRYDRVHLAYLIAISVLKQILTVGEVHAGIERQTQLSGLRQAYNIFCEELESALRVVSAQAGAGAYIPVLGEEISRERLALRMAALSFATKLYTQKILSMEHPSEQEAAENCPHKKKKSAKEFG